MCATGCTLYHSKQAVWHGDEPPAADATFVTEEDSGLSLLGVIVVAEPDHYAVLLERARQRYKCARLTHIQLDYYTDFWLLIGFPIARLTAVCEPFRTPG